MRCIRALGIGALGLLAACKSGDEQVVPAGSGAPSATTSTSVPLDRLAPGELSAGKLAVLGLAVPRGMRVDAVFQNEAHMSGDVSPEALANYVRDRVSTQHVEIGAARTVFPIVKIKAGDARRTYRIEIVRDVRITRLAIRDITPPPTTPGLSEADRWRKAGMTPRGEVLDPKKLE
jgi:hypothetical protein